MGEDLRIGVWVCECGGNIGDVVEVPSLAKSLKSEVAYVREERYLCSSPSVENIKDMVGKRNLDRVVLACCTPNMHWETFKEGLEEAGLNPALLEIVNIREQCSWVHKGDHEGATRKALDLIRGAISRAKESVALESKSMDVVREVLVIGGGVAGITTSLRMAESGLKVHLVEKNASIGGHMRNIDLITYAEVAEVTGVPGDFNVKVRLKRRGVNVEECINCGACARVCPEEVPDEFNEGLNTRKAVYMPFPQAVPSVYTIDFDSCTKCLKCSAICPRKCIDPFDQGSELELNVGAIVMATGFELYDIGSLANYGYGKYPNVVTGLEMERILDVNGPTGSMVVVPETGREAKSVTYVLCAGSRDTEVGKSYCSRVCCLYALKQAQLLRDRGIDVWIHYIDIRSPGRRYEEFYRTTQDKGAMFVKGKVTEIVPQGEQVLVRGEDMMIDRMVENPADLVVLCPPIVTSKETLKLAEILRVPVDEDQFVLERHPKLDPMATKRDGIFAAGVVVGPKDIQSTTAEAEGAAMKAVNFLSGERVIEPNKAYLDRPELCDACGDCVKACPESAITIEAGKALINEIMCTGCGACIPACPHNALDQQGLTESQLKAQIKGTLEASESEIKILAFAERQVAYTAIDLAGLARLSYPSSIRIIPLPSLARLKLDHLLTAFAYGADGIMFLEAPEHEGPYGNAHVISEERADDYRWELEDHDVDSVRMWFSRVYVPDWRKLERIFQTFHNMIKDEGPLEDDVRESLMEELT
jgi:heterodisulfide reductase subunit A